MAVEGFSRGASSTVLTITANMTNGQVVGGGNIDNSVIKATHLEITVSAPSGLAVAPTANNTIDIFLARNGDTPGSSLTNTPVSPSGLASTDGMEAWGAIPLPNSSAGFTVTKCLPLRFMESFRLAQRNSTGQTILGSAGSPITTSARLVQRTIT